MWSYPYKKLHSLSAVSTSGFKKRFLNQTCTYEGQIKRGLACSFLKIGKKCPISEKNTLIVNTPTFFLVGLFFAVL